MTFDEIGLIHYVPNTTRLRAYIGWMKRCHTIKQLMDRVIYIMLLTEKYVTKDTADKKDFYESCLPFITHICTSIPITTWRDNVYRVWAWIIQNEECKAIIAHKNDRMTESLHIIYLQGQMVLPKFFSRQVLWLCLILPNVMQNWET